MSSILWLPGARSPPVIIIQPVICACPMVKVRSLRDNAAPSMVAQTGTSSRRWARVQGDYLTLRSISGGAKSEPTSGLEKIILNRQNPWSGKNPPSSVCQLFLGIFINFQATLSQSVGQLHSRRQ